jgi:hypothetical protein
MNNPSARYTRFEHGAGCCHENRALERLAKGDSDIAVAPKARHRKVMTTYIIERDRIRRAGGQCKPILFWLSRPSLFGNVNYLKLAQSRGGIAPVAMSPDVLKQ